MSYTIQIDPELPVDEFLSQVVETLIVQPEATATVDFVTVTDSGMKVAATLSVTIKTMERAK